MVMHVATDENGASSFKFLTEDIAISGNSRNAMYTLMSMLSPK